MNQYFSQVFGSIGVLAVGIFIGYLAYRSARNIYAKIKASASRSPFDGAYAGRTQLTPDIAAQLEAAFKQALSQANGNHEHTEKTVAAIVEQLVISNKRLFSLCETMEEVLRTERRIAGSFSGAPYEQITPEREREEAIIDGFMSRYGMPREEAEMRARNERTYSREALGLRRG